MKRPSSRTSRKAASSLGISGPYSALTSTSGIVCTIVHFSPRSPFVDQIRDDDDDDRDDAVLDVVEAVVEALVAGAEPVADPGNRECPDRRADEREDGLRRQRHLEDTGRDGDEGG